MSKWTQEDVDAINRRRLKPLEIKINPPIIEKRHKYRAIPCIVTADLTLFTLEDIRAAEACACLDCNRSKPSQLKKRAALVGIIGEWFGSTKEAKCWIELKRRAAAGEIKNLQRQVPFELCCPDWTHVFNNPVENFPTVARYVCDFFYETGSSAAGNYKQHVVDAKGQRTAMYKLKKKWLELQSGIVIEEV